MKSNQRNLLFKDRRRTTSTAVLISLGIHFVLVAALSHWAFKKIPFSDSQSWEVSEVDLTLFQVPPSPSSNLRASVPAEKKIHPPEKNPLPQVSLESVLLTLEEKPFSPPTPNQESFPTFEEETPTLHLSENSVSEIMDFSELTRSGASTSVEKPEISTPRRIQFEKPRYPLAAQRQGIQGTVSLRLLINPEGTVIQVAVSESSGYSILDAAAMRSAKKWKFMPAVKNGIPITAIAIQPIEYILQ